MFFMSINCIFCFDDTLKLILSSFNRRFFTNTDKEVKIKKMNLFINKIKYFLYKNYHLPQFSSFSNTGRN